MAFEVFTKARLEAYLRKHLLSADGLEYLRKALTAPSRNVQGSTKNVVSDVPCPLMGMNMQTESWRTEHPFTLEKIFNPDIVGYVNQPPVLELSYRGKNNRKVRTSYTPDSLSLNDRTGTVLEEWKPASARKSLLEDCPGKYRLDEDGIYRSDPIDEAIKGWGMTFQVRFSDEITSIAERNRKFLRSYLYPAAIRSYEPMLAALLASFRNYPYVPFPELMDFGHDADSIYFAIANRHLFIDFDAVPLATERDSSLIFRDDVTLSTWKMAINPDGERPSHNGHQKINDLCTGDKIVVDGVKLAISMVGTTCIFANNDDGLPIQLERINLVNLLRDGKAQLPSRDARMAGSSLFYTASPNALLHAAKRAEILKRMDLRLPLAIDQQYSPSTLRKWKRAVSEGAERGLSPVESLIDCADGRGFRGPHIDCKSSDMINAWIRSALSNNKNLSKLACHGLVKALAEENNIEMIALSSFYERVKWLETVSNVRDSRGHKVAYQLTPTYWMLEVKTPIHYERALEAVHMDSTLLDVELRSSLSNDTMVRPWLTLAICAYSRRVVGMYLSFQPPSYVSSMMVLLDIVKRFGRIPDSIIHDWGSEFKAKDFKNALTMLHIERHIRPKSAARFGTVLERMFGILTRVLIDNIAGNTKQRKNVRTLTADSNPSVHSGLWLEDLYQGVEEYFFNIYDNTKHPTTFQKPRERFEASFLSTGFRLHQVRNYQDVLPLLLPIARGSPRTIDPVRGIYVNNRFYGNSLLAVLGRKGDSVLVRPNRFDPGSVLAYLNGRWVVCKSSLYDRLQRLPEIARRCFFEELVVEQSLVRKSKEMNRGQLNKLMEAINQKALDNIAYRKDADSKVITDVANLDAEPMDLLQAQEIDHLNERMAQALKSIEGSMTAGRLVGEDA